MTIMRLPLQDYSETELAVHELAAHLAHGSLALVLGAGTSKSLDLPLWSDLVARCQQEVGITKPVTHDSSNDDLRRAAEEVEQRAGNFETFREIVRHHLYDGVKFAEDNFLNPTLASLGALMMGSRRGSVTEVLTLNFDDVLEWYLGLHGFVTRTISTLPQLAQDADVHIYHPHGFLPHICDRGPGSDFLIFSQYAYDFRSGDRTDPWTTLTRDLLLRKVCLFIGLSGDDPLLRGTLTLVGNELKDHRYTGFWIRRKNIDPDAESKECAELLRRNIVPLSITDFSDIPQFLLTVCQKAAKQLAR